MENKKMVNAEDITAENIRSLIELLAQPIDFENLISNGVLEKNGHWYKLIKPNQLPEHATRKIIRIMSANDTVKVQFESEKPYGKLQQKLK